LAGEYREPVELVSGITLKSHVPREAVLHAGVHAQNARDARLIGFRIAGERPVPAAVLVVDSVVDLEQNEIDGAAVGIEIRGASRVTLVGNSIHDCLGEGLLMSGPVEAWISHNSFQRNKNGLVARDGAKPALVGNVFEKNLIVLPPEISMDTVRDHNFILDAKPAPHGKKKE
jgi:nitrous oxidase accessory protein NosD